MGPAHFCGTMSYLRPARLQPERLEAQAGLAWCRAVIQVMTLQPSNLSPGALQAQALLPRLCLLESDASQTGRAPCQAAAALPEAAALPAGLPGSAQGSRLVGAQGLSQVSPSFLIKSQCLTALTCSSPSSLHATPPTHPAWRCQDLSGCRTG